MTKVYPSFDCTRFLKAIEKNNKDYQSCIGIACGGTGGHVYPAIALAEALARHQIKVLLLIAGHNSARFINEIKQRNLDYLELRAIKNPISFIEKLSLPLELLSIIQSNRKQLKTYQLSSVISMGGGPAHSVCLSLFNCPLYLHEANAVLGRSNRLLLPFAEKCFLAMP